MIAQDFRSLASFYRHAMTTDDTGGQVPQLVLYFRAWAKFERGSQNLQLQNGQIVVNAPNTITMRWQPECDGLIPECEVIIGDKTLLITSVVTDELRQYTTIIAA